uniref:Uncharacterized protein n=1 Tax=Myoviridae sp. ctfvB24 TaxID=2826679 RepID=A0A8S5MA08_9CAUD|nr:MAG TPA: hypothetical protein [Myoviridae sp. ctfvB24]
MPLNRFSGVSSTPVFWNVAPKEVISEQDANSLGGIFTSDVQP